MSKARFLMLAVSTWAFFHLGLLLVGVVLGGGAVELFHGGDCP